MFISVSDSRRIEWIDTLRGIAIAGMVLVHVSKSSHGSGPAFERWQQGFDFFATGKFYTIFALLFGIGFGLELLKDENRRATPVAFLRRLGCLALIMAALKLIFGSSLLYYAIWGAPLVLLYRLSSRWLIAAAVALWCFQSQLAFFTWADPGRRGPFVLAMFIAGLLAVRHGLVHDVAKHRGVLVAIAISGLGLSLAGQGISGTRWLGFTYAVAVVLLFPQGISIVTAVGRTSLSNYALHLAVLHSLFDKWGLALSLDWRLSVPVALAVFSLMAAASTWWLRYYKHGPIEWLWRSMTAIMTSGVFFAEKDTRRHFSYGWLPPPRPPGPGPDGIT